MSAPTPCSAYDAADRGYWGLAPPPVRQALYAGLREVSDITDMHAAFADAAALDRLYVRAQGLAVLRLVRSDPVSPLLCQSMPLLCRLPVFSRMVELVSPTFDDIVEADIKEQL